MKKNKKVLLITNDFYPSHGGIQECIMGLASSFRENATVLAPYYPGHKIINDRRLHFTVRRTNGLRQDRMLDKFLFLFLRRPFTFLLQTASQVYRMRKLEICDFIICGHLTTILIGMLARKLMVIPLGSIVHGKELFFRGPLSPYKQIFAKFLLNRSDFLFLSNSFMKSKLLEMGINEEKIVKIPFGVNMSSNRNSAELRKRNQQKVILTVGRLVERKGHDLVISVLPAILKRYQNVEYWIVGKGPLEKQLRELVKKHKLDECVKFHGEVDNIADLYANSDVFVMPSRFIEKKGDVEGFGLVFLEANYFGKPVIAGNSGGISDAVIDGVTGILVNPEDPKEITDAIIKLFNNPELAKNLGEQGRKRVIEEFTWERAADIIERTMTEIKRGNEGMNRSSYDKATADSVSEKRRKHKASEK